MVASQAEGTVGGQCAPAAEHREAVADGRFRADLRRIERARIDRVVVPQPVYDDRRIAPALRQAHPRAEARCPLCGHPEPRPGCSRPRFPHPNRPSGQALFASLTTTPRSAVDNAGCEPVPPTTSQGSRAEADLRS